MTRVVSSTSSHVPSSPSCIVAAAYCRRSRRVEKPPCPFCRSGSSPLSYSPSERVSSMSAMKASVGPKRSHTSMRLSSVKMSTTSVSALPAASSGLPV